VKLCDSVNQALIRSWNQPVLNNERNRSCSMKQREPLMGFEITTDRHPPITRQTVRNSTKQFYFFIIPMQHV